MGGTIGGTMESGAVASLEDYAREFARKGGLARSKKLSAEERRRIAALGGYATKGIPKGKKKPKRKKNKKTAKEK
jgi:hypothetical protein